MKVVISIDNGEVISAQADGEDVEVLVVEGPECNIQSFKAEFAPTAVWVVQGLRCEERPSAS
jgi:hypothetical protein